MEKLTVCKGCFTDWNDVDFQCQWCGWCPDMGPGMGSAGEWSVGTLLEKRYLLGNIYLKTVDGYTVWRVYDRHLDIKCFFLAAESENVHWLAKIAWGFAERPEGGIKVLGLKEFSGKYVLIFGMKDNFLPIGTFRGMVHPREENVDSVPGRVDPQINAAVREVVLPEDTLLGGRYQIIGCLGIGGFGIMYLCEDILLQRDVAVKEYFPEKWAEREGIYVGSRTSGTLQAYRFGLSSFLEEAKITAKFIDVEHIVTAFDVFQENDTAYIVMEYVPGKSIAKEFRKREFRPYSPYRTVEILVPVLLALKELHGQQVIHGDLSPGNIMRTPKGEIVLIDFGAARYYLEKGKKRVIPFLKTDYAAPEQFRAVRTGNSGEEGPWTDIYAVGAIMYYFLTGHKPADAMTRMSARSSKLEPPKKYGVKLKKGWMKLIHRCVELEYKKRISSCQTVVEEMLNLLKHEKEGG